MRTAIAVLAKTPGLSPVKTRLAATIGKDRAEEFYRMSIKAVEEMLAQVVAKSDTLIQPYWAVAEPEGMKRPIWRSFPAIWTGKGDFGQRIYHVLTTLLKEYDQVVIIGTDSPQLEAKVLLKAVKEITAHPDRCQIGPCFDGGFYLFGCAVPIPKTVWTGVTYSKNYTLKQLLGYLKDLRIEYTFLPMTGDVDTYNDLFTLLKALSATNRSNLPAQLKLYRWVKDNTKLFYPERYYEAYKFVAAH